MQLQNGRKTIICISLIILTGMLVSAGDGLHEQVFAELMKVEIEKPEISLPDYEHREFANGMTVYLVEDDEYPIVEILGFLEGGRRQESRETAGYAQIMAEMMATGTQHLDEQSFSRKKEHHGITLSYRVQNDAIDMYASSLADGKKSLISLIAESLREPEFEAPRFQRILQEYQQYIAQAAVREDDLLRSQFYQAVYQDHPYSFTTDIQLTQENLKDCSAEDLKQLHRESVGPENLVLAVVGDIDGEKTAAMLEERFADWKPQGIDIKQPSVEKDQFDAGRIIIVDKEDAEQAHMKTGYPFSGRGFEKETEFLIGNRIFGAGGFSSRLIEQIRSEKGYVYSMYSRASLHELGGAFSIQTEAEAKRIPQIFDAVQDEMEKLASGEQGITQEELEQSINAYNGLLPAAYRQTTDVMEEFIREVELYGQREDYLEQFVDDYNTIELEELQQVMEDTLRPHWMVTVVVGNSDELEQAFLEAGYEADSLEIVAY